MCIICVWYVIIINNIQSIQHSNKIRILPWKVACSSCWGQWCDEEVETILSDKKRGLKHPTHNTHNNNNNNNNQSTREHQTERGKKTERVNERHTASDILLRNTEHYYFVLTLVQTFSRRVTHYCVIEDLNLVTYSI